MILGKHLWKRVPFVIKDILSRNEQQQDWFEPESRHVLEIIRGRRSGCSLTLLLLLLFCLFVLSFFLFLLFRYRSAAENLTNGRIPPGWGEISGSNLGDDGENHRRSDVYLFITSLPALLILLSVFLKCLSGKMSLSESNTRVKTGWSRADHLEMLLHGWTLS